VLLRQVAEQERAVRGLRPWEVGVEVGAAIAAAVAPAWGGRMGPYRVVILSLKLFSCPEIPYGRNPA
jgi:hypothetical protein